MSEVPRGSEECSLPDDLSWLGELSEETTWNDLSPRQRDQILRSQTDSAGEEDPYIPNNLVTNLIGLLNDYGVVDAASIDNVIVRQQIGLEYARKPDKLEEALRRVRDRKDLANPEKEFDKPSLLKLDDLVKELDFMRQEEEYEKEIQKDIELLEIMGVDPRELLTMHEQGKEGWDSIHSVASDLRTPLCEDITDFYIKKFHRKRKKEIKTWISFDNLFLSVTARKMRGDRMRTELLSGNDASLRRAVKRIRDLQSTEEGLQKLSSLANDTNNPGEIAELLLALLETSRRMDAEAKDDFFEPGDAGWEEAP
ncbi:hypothetical protein A3B63_00980 [Candidatus Saccharibacteria bacterium RIFCSPLOWO2_01_FULL_49_22]|nr:MAG: hypothetical protein A3B63_00980 [Candidatus Saccharibacteria bacterium RIFCSPLOWO2_01_FULL_49_22]